MTKLLWVALPLLLAAVLLALQALLRGRPTRHALNVWLSLLLLAYVATTAGLGIFWVANQQLPVFDWHYLFGYGTVLLVLLHLGFNFRIVWRHLTGLRATPPAPMPAAMPAGAPVRRWALGLLGAALAGGAAFVFGLRHGRGGPETAAAAPSAAGGLDTVERFHAFSSHTRTGVLLRAPSVDWGDAPPAFKRYAQAERLALPPPQGATGAFGAAALGRVLWHVAGVTEERGTLALRAAPSSGALFSTELYVQAQAVPGLAPGWWHYDARSHALERLGAAPAAARLPAAPVLVVATAVFRRTGHKYRDRAWRYLLADLGHALENLRVAAAALGWGTTWLARFDETRIAAALGLDEDEEGVLAVVLLAPGAAPAPAAAPALPGLGPAPPPGAGARLGVTTALYRASSLRAPAAADAPVPAASAVTLPAAASAARIDTLGLIAARRSRRRYAPTPVPLAALGDVLDAMDGRVAPLLSHAVRVNLVANAVAGLHAGAWRHDAARRLLLPRRVPQDLRAAARAAALDQDVIGEAAVVFVLSIDRATVAADADGAARGYRHAYIEAGLVGERIYLAAQARSLGVCAVGAFYDDEAAALVGLDPAREWVVHFAALGVPEQTGAASDPRARVAERTRG